MANRLVKPPRISQTAEVKHVPYRPAYCVSQVVKKPSASDGGGRSAGGVRGSAGLPLNATGSFMLAFAGSNPSIFYGGISGGSALGPAGSGSSGGSSTSTTCYPEQREVKGAPARLVVSLEPGWNASASSRQRLFGDFVFSFDVCPYPVGVVIGIAPANNDTLFTTAEHAFYLRGGEISVLESGAVVASCPLSPVDRPRLSISRVGQAVVYSADGWAYVSQNASVGDKVGDALLYSAGDYVDNPAISTAVAARAVGAVGIRNRLRETASARGRVGFSASMRKVRGSILLRGGASAVLDTAAAARGRVGVSGAARPSTNEGRVSLPGLQLFASDHPTGYGRAELPALRVSADSGFALPDIGVGAIGIPAPMLSGIMLVGGNGEGSVSLPALEVIGADYEYGIGRVALPEIIMAGSERVYDPDGEFMLEYVYLHAPVVTDNVAYLAWRERIGVGFDLIVSVFVEDLIYESLIVGDKMSQSQIMYEVLRSAVSIYNSGSLVDDVVLQYATNLVTGAASRYENFEFTGFFNDGLDSYAWDENGVYRIADGVGDDGEPLAAAIDFAAAGTDSSAEKYLTAAYFGIATDGQVYARVTTHDGREQLYKANPGRGHHRAVTAKGITARYWNVRLELTDATFADLDSIEWDIPVATRRMHSR